MNNMNATDQWDNYKVCRDTLKDNHDFELPSTKLNDFNIAFSRIGFKQKFDQITKVTGDKGTYHLGHTTTDKLLPLETLLVGFRSAFVAQLQA